MNRHTNNPNPTQNMSSNEHDQRDIELTATFDVEAARDYIYQNCREKLRQNAAQIADELNDAYIAHAQHVSNEREDEIEIVGEKAYIGHIYAYQTITRDILEQLSGIEKHEGDMYELKEATERGVRAHADELIVDWPDDAQIIWEVEEQ